MTPVTFNTFLPARVTSGPCMTVLLVVDCCPAARHMNYGPSRERVNAVFSPQNNFLRSETHLIFFFLIVKIYAHCKELGNSRTFFKLMVLSSYYIVKYLRILFHVSLNIKTLTE